MKVEGIHRIPRRIVKTITAIPTTVMITGAAGGISIGAGGESVTATVRN